MAHYANPKAVEVDETTKRESTYVSVGSKPAVETA
jgi:hypothetical protein